MNIPKVDYRYRTLDDQWEIIDPRNGMTLMTVNQNLFQPEAFVREVIERYNFSDTHDNFKAKLDDLEESVESLEDEITSETMMLKREIDALRKEVQNATKRG